MTNKNDKDLFIALKKGDKTALSELFNRYYDFLLHYGLKITPDDFIVEECIQELFVYLFEAGDRLGAVENIKAYLFTAIRRRILKKIKREHRQTVNRRPSSGAPDIQFSSEEIWIRQEGEQHTQQLLYQALNELSARQREAIYLRYFNGLNTRDIAAVMGVSNQTVLNTLYQALQKMSDKEYLKSLINLSYPLLLIPIQYFSI